MRSVLLVITSIFVLCGVVSAEMSITPKVGVSMSTYKSEELDEYFENVNSRKPSLMGLRMAVEANYHIDKIVTGLEVGYSRRGIMFDIDVFGNDVEFAHKLTYLDISPVVGYDFVIHKLSLIPRIKPSLSILLGGVISEIINGEETVTDIDSDAVETLDFSLDFGFEAVLADKLVFGLGYDLGLMDIVIDETNIFSDGYNRAVYFTMGYKFNL